MESRRLNVRAVICDVYQTLLEVGPPPADAPARWVALWRRTFGHEPPWSLLEFAAACSRVIAREHAAARACGIAFPEVWWPAVVAEVLPAWRSLAPARQAAFIAAHMQLGRSLRLMPGAAAALRALAGANLALGLASNAQAYTWGELDEALRGAGLTADLFAPDLCFWSCQHGFSKPDPHVFRILTARLAARGIGPAETLMVGDREDNDLTPARAQGWQTWRLGAADGPVGPGGEWPALVRWLGLA